MNNLQGEGCPLLIPREQLKDIKTIEKSLYTTYKKRIWNKFTKAVKEYNLVEENDRILVAVSGGKDSLILAKLFQHLKRVSTVPFELEFVAMDPGWHESNVELINFAANHLEIPLQIYKSSIFEIVQDIAEDYPCYMCARMRRGFLYSKCVDLKCNKLALAHHFDDVIETTLINVFYGGKFETMLPKLNSTNFENIQLIRPLYLVKEQDIMLYTHNAGVSPMNCGCVVVSTKTSSKRREIKNLITELRKIDPDIDKRIFNSANNVNLDKILGWKQGETKYSPYTKKEED